MNTNRDIDSIRHPVQHWSSQLGESAARLSRDSHPAFLGQLAGRSTASRPAAILTRHLQRFKAQEHAADQLNAEEFAANP